MSLEELETFVENHGVTIIYQPNRKAPGDYYLTRKLIILDTRLQSMPKNAVSTLAHEYAHHLLGHDGPQPPAEERRADQVAAQLIISPTDYALAEQLHDGHIPAMAEELGVTTWIVIAYQQCLGVR